MNLNTLEVGEKCWDEKYKIKDFRCSNGFIDIEFRNIKERIIKEINESELVAGCVAWLTNKDILEAMKGKTNIVVQKEDFLRPDNYKKNELHTYYEKIKSGLCFQELTNFKFSYCGMSECEGVRCFGNHNSNKSPAFPRMHHKFIVLYKINGIKIIPQKVITGSFNFTHNAENSLENIIIINNKKIAEKYYNEFSQIMCLSEPLNWESAWIAPEHRLGS